MNLFLLSLDRRQCVRWYADKHIIKMILELAQLLYTVWHKMEDPSWKKLAPSGGYKATHVNHPIAIWMRESKENYNFAASYGIPMAEEYTRRYGKIHGCRKHIEWLVNNIPNNLSNRPLTQLPQAMPNEYKVNDRCGTMEDSVSAYRIYYKEFKLKTIKITYTNTEWPDWLPKQDSEEFKRKIQGEPSTYLTLNIIRPPTYLTLNIMK